MPIQRMPVVHKFGIISQTQRVDLEKRIAKKAYLESRRKLEAQQPSEPRPLPFEVTEDFVYKFNDSGDEQREKLQDTALKMLKRLERLAGLRQAGDADHVDLPRAWVDLALLAQCRSSKLEEACLEALVASLDQAVVCEEQVLSLFYLAKSGVHWLKKDAGNQSVLRSNEILLLKMTRLVFIRLYCHHLLGQLKEYQDQRTSLGQYLEGFADKARFFNHFPGAYLSVQIISEAGRFICSSIVSSTKEETIDINTTTSTSHETMLQQMLDNKTVHGDREAGVVNTRQDISPGNSIFLRCSLNVWHAVNYDTNSLNHALYDLLESATNLFEEQWLELVLAFHILADASCCNVRVLEAFQYFMSLDFSPVVIPVDRAPHLCETCYSSLPTSPEKKARNSTSFRDNLAKNESVASEERNTTSSLVETLQEFVGLNLSPEQGTLEDVALRKTQDSASHSNQPRRYEQDDGENSWRIRYGAMKGLVRVCRHYSNDVTKDGVTNTAWSLLTQRQSTESESRVLEAIKIAKVEAELEKKLSIDHIPTSLWTSRLATALTHMLHYQVFPTQIYTPMAFPTRPDLSQSERTTQIRVPSQSERCKKPTLRQEINLSNAYLQTRDDYNTRRNLELRTVIEDQWKKQLLEDMENETKTNIQELEKKREQELQRIKNKNQESVKTCV